MIEISENIYLKMSYADRNKTFTISKAKIIALIELKNAKCIEMSFNINKETLPMTPLQNKRILSKQKFSSHILSMNFLYVRL